MSLVKQGDSPSRPRWVWYSAESSPIGGRGPFGPFEAKDRDEAESIAESRARSADLTLERVKKA